MTVLSLYCDTVYTPFSTRRKMEYKIKYPGLATMEQQNGLGTVSSRLQAV